MQKCWIYCICINIKIGNSERLCNIYTKLNSAFEILVSKTTEDFRKKKCACKAPHSHRWGHGCTKRVGGALARPPIPTDGAMGACKRVVGALARPPIPTDVALATQSVFVVRWQGPPFKDTSTSPRLLSRKHPAFVLSRNNVSQHTQKIFLI